MAYDYNLELDTDRSPSEILSILLRGDRFRKARGQDALEGTGLRVTAWRVTDKYDVELTESVYGFTPKINVTFSQAKEGPDGASLEDMLASVVRLLDVVDGDAALESESPEVVLHRGKGKIAVNANWEGHELLVRLAPGCQVKAFDKL